MQNLILSAHSKGLGTCPQGAVAIWEDAVRREFEISKNLFKDNYLKLSLGKKRHIQIELN